MFVNLGLILEILYELTIFVLFAILTYKTMANPITSWLASTLKEEKDRNRSLTNKFNLTKSAIFKLNDSIKDQNRQFVTIEEKMKIWHDSVVADQEAMKVETDKIVSEFKEKTKIQKKQLHIDKVQQEVMPNAINLAKEEFVKYSKKDGREILTNLILKLEKKIS